MKRNTLLDSLRVTPSTQVVLGMLAEARGTSVAKIVRDGLDAYAARPEVAAMISEYREQQESIETAKALAHTAVNS